MVIQSTISAPVLSFGSGYARNASESANPDLWDGLLNFWAPQIGKTGSEIRDYGPSRRHATLVSGSTVRWRPDLLGWSLDVNEDMWTIADSGSSDPLRLGTSDFTILCRAKSTGTGGPSGASLFSRDEGANTTNWSIQYQTVGTSLRFKYNNSLLGTTALSVKGDGIWHCFTAVRDGDEGRWYVDGVLDDTQATYFSSANFTATQALNFAGSTTVRTAKEWIGRIGPFAIWKNRVLTASEIRLLHFDPLAPLRLRRRAHIGFVPAVGGNAMPMAMHGYRLRRSG